MTDVTPLDVFSWEEARRRMKRNKQGLKSRRRAIIIIFERHTNPHFLSLLSSHDKENFDFSFSRKKTRKWGQNNDADPSFSSSSQSEGDSDRFLLTGGWILRRRRCCCCETRVFRTVKREEVNEEGMNFLQNRRAFKGQNVWAQKETTFSQRIVGRKGSG